MKRSRSAMRDALLVLAFNFLTTPGGLNAAPIPYAMTFVPTLGPAGTATFMYDPLAKSVTNFTWNFGSAVIGGISDQNFTGVFLADTMGAFFFEIVSQTDVSTDADCIGSSCLFGRPVAGNAPNAAVQVTFVSDPALPIHTTYRFNAAGVPFGGPVVASGTFSISPAPVLPPTLQSATSRKVHGAVGTFDLPLTLTP